VTDHPNAALARSAMDAFNQGDLEAFAATIHDDVVWHAPGANRFSGERAGKASSLERFKEQAQDGLRVSFDDVHDIVANDEHVVALLTIRFTRGDDSVTSPSIFVMHVRAGKMVEFWAMNERQNEIDALVG
jgi:ketosteroid isomerase-like protein